MGLRNGHAYSLLGAAVLSDGTKLVQLRNPWGSTEWEGDWSDESPLWNDTNSHVRGAAKDDGCFWIPVRGRPDM